MRLSKRLAPPQSRPSRPAGTWPGIQDASTNAAANTNRYPGLRVDRNRAVGAARAQDGAAIDKCAVDGSRCYEGGRTRTLGRNGAVESQIAGEFGLKADPLCAGPGNDDAGREIGRVHV